MLIKEKFNLYIKIGNTSTTFAYFPNLNIDKYEVFHISTKSLFNNKFKEQIDKIINDFNIEINKVYCSSVLIDSNNLIKDYFFHKDIDVTFLTYKNQWSLDLSSLYNPFEIGSDILASSTYITNFFNEAILVSLGTATTICHINGNKFNGAIIMPGIEMSYQSLINQTKIQPINNLEVQKTLLGKNTKEAVSIGVLNSIEIMIKALMKENKINCPIIFSGGYYRQFNLNNSWYIPNLEILGLYIFSQRNK